MSDLPNDHLPSSASGAQGQHYEFIKNAVPECLIKASPQRRLALKQTRPHIPDWYAALNDAQREVLNSDLDTQCHSQNALDTLMRKVQDVEAFAGPLLTAALAEAGHVLDVDQVHLRLYVPVDDSFGRRTSGYRVKTFSLLQAALNNFEASEAEADYFNVASGFITAPNALGHFQAHSTRLKIDEFARLCRTLDLGGQYQKHLSALMRPDDVVSQGYLRARYLAHQKDAFKAAARLALFTGDIGEDDYDLLMRVAAGEKRIMLGDKQVWYRTPCLMNLHLRGCVIIDPCVKYQYSDWIIAYIPDDPEHPIKRYASFDAFRQALTRQLTRYPQSTPNRRALAGPAQYQVFFSRFVAQKDRPYYYRRFTETVVDAPAEPWLFRWLRSEQGALWARLLVPDLVLSSLDSILGDPRHTLRVPLEGPNLHINADSMKGLWEEVDLWNELYEGMRDRLFEDACTQAIPTASTDAANRSRRLSHYLSIGLLTVGTMSMVVPPLGAVMMLATAGQLLYEVLEGAVELSEGDREAGWSHITDVVENLAMLAGGSVAFHVVGSPFVENLKAVLLPNGKTRLWKPELKPYEQTLALPDWGSPDANGLLQHNGRSVLPLEGKYFVLGEEVAGDTYRIQHPTRSEAYQPLVRHNGDGAWVDEADRPRTWQGATLMRRLGAVVDGFSDEQLEQIRRVSDVDDDWLRRLHTESEPTPSLLLETARRFRAYDNACKVGEQIALGRMSDELAGYAAILMVELPEWPAGRGIEVFNERAEEAPLQYHEGDRLDPDPIRISQAELRNGGLPARVVDSLSEDQLNRLLLRSVAPNAESRTVALTEHLIARAEQCRLRLFTSLSSNRQVLAEATVRVVLRDFNKLTTRMAREALNEATPAEHQAIPARQRLPLRVAQKARELQAQVRLAQAYEGLYLPELVSADTEALVLNTLDRLPGWQDNVRIETREGSVSGRLRASRGPEGIDNRKVIVQTAPGQYQAFDGEGNQLHGINGLYGSLQHALPDAQRAAIGLPHVGQGEQLHRFIVQHALPHKALRQVLGMRPVRQSFFRRPRRLSGGRRGYPLSGRGVGQAPERGNWRLIIEERVRSLYPTISEQEMSEFLEGRDLTDDRWLKDLEADHKAFEHVINHWLLEGPRTRRALLARRKICDALREAKQLSGTQDFDAHGDYRGQTLVLKGRALGPLLETLPDLSGHVDSVSKLVLGDVGLTDASAGFLSNFRGVRFLDIEENQLTRLPDAIRHMPRLEFFGMAENQVVLTEEDVVHIRGLRHLEAITVEGNPLGKVLDISQMVNLRGLYMASTGIDRWPVGVFARPRPRGFVLDMTSNAITQIPDVAPGSDRAQILARTMVSRELLSPEVLRKLKLYIESVGLDPERRFPVRGTQDSAHWMKGLTPEQWLERQPVWDAVEESLGAEPFFDELRKLSDSSDALDLAFQENLTIKVWRMLEAMAEDTALREKLFEMAAAPTTCVDAGAQLFNAMGVEVMVYEARTLPDLGLMKLEFLELAKGKSRLDELGRIAHARVADLLEQGRKFPAYDADGNLIPHRDPQGNPVRSIDEVEIHLAYVTQLAGRLDLPWQSESMMFEEPDVTPTMVNEAYNRVLVLEQGDLLRDNILEQPFWVEFVEETHPDAFEVVNAKNEALINLFDAQEALADGSDLSSIEQQQLRNTIQASAEVLGMLPGTFIPGRRMSDPEFYEDMARLGEERQTILRTLTDKDMGRTPVPRPERHAG
ncbi:C-terminal novel E3 ligase, LRR-interacting [Pseudomonas sp. ok272]|uniref:dermonecrotic toxin domain-containing protein n=1 Tax=unclassified Pseudomonas TaxID=196821 RepID=UPI0008BE23E3|nr:MULTISPECIES: DUF6543 domain-containing protein [unclassified Pseudomonas]SEM88360.1 C-terminal novel E3 ligase, LRR-interacting [Pseudomonas sp. ok272]SFM75096.1 C-terminal novel E3 ligase, LRR-interacting [Pseudomonas sp. ok602]